MKTTSKLFATVLSFILILCSIFSLTAIISASAYELEEDPTVIEVVYHEVDGEEDTLSSKYVYDRDNKGNLLSNIFYEYSEEGWIPSYKNEYMYDSNGNVTFEQESDYDSDTSTWYKSCGVDYIYDEKGNETKSSRFEYTEENQTDKVYFMYTLYEYDSNGLMIKDTVCYLDEDDETSYYISSYHTYKYNESNQLVEKTYYSFATTGDPTTEYISKVITYTYAPNGEYASVDETSYSGRDVFYLCSYTLYEYDNENRVTKETVFKYKSADHQNLEEVDQYRSTYNGVEQNKEHYTGSHFEEGYMEELLKYESTETLIDTDEEYKYSRSYLDSEGKTVYLYGGHDVRVFENGYVVLEKIYDINEDGTETQTGYNVVTTKELPKEEPTEEPTEETEKFPVWIIPTSIVIVLVAAYVCGYFFLYIKGKVSGKFFETIYGWFKNLLNKLSKKK